MRAMIGNNQVTCEIFRRASRASFHRLLSARAIVFLALLAQSLPFALSGFAADRQVLHGHVPDAIARLAPVERLPASQRIHLAIGLPLRNRSALTNLLQQIYDPASPSFHHYLTPEQFTEQFGPTEQDYQAVIAF